MKNIFSLVSCFIICAVLLQFRCTNPGQGKPLNVTTWDALGYYIYLPSFFIYHDYKDLKWLTEVDKKYSVTGGNGWQAIKTDSGYVFKYLGGVALMEIPFFLIGHYIALHYGYPPDGFSPPYEYALAFGVIFYCFLACLILRRVLLFYFNDRVTAITLLMVCLATNFIQYAAVDNGQSHAYIFPLYAIVLYATIAWHRKPSVCWACVIGYVIGLATMTRPTEAVMLFIPLFWNTQTKEAASEKWALVKRHSSHIFLAALCGFIGIAPQIIYWKLASGSFIFDVGSSWDFLTPHFRVLFGWEKGWFIYTPVTVFFIVGMFFIKHKPFRKSVLWFCLLNIYIIIAWRTWRYGGSYSTRALMQSYPVFALPFAAFIDRLRTNNWQWLFYLLLAYLLGINIFQTWQYDKTILHFDDMNRLYYSHIYLNPHPSPIDMSLLDTDEMLSDEKDYHKTVIFSLDTPMHLQIHAGENKILADDLPTNTAPEHPAEEWIKVECTLKVADRWGSYLCASLQRGDSVKQTRIRLFTATSSDSSANKYAFYMKVPEYFYPAKLKLTLNSTLDFNGVANQITITKFAR